MVAAMMKWIVKTMIVYWIDQLMNYLRPAMHKQKNNCDNNNNKQSYEHTL